jgi:hypothetical protein
MEVIRVNRGAAIGQGRGAEEQGSGGQGEKTHPPSAIYDLPPSAIYDLPPAPLPPFIHPSLNS